MPTESIKDNLYFTFLQTSQKNSITVQSDFTSWRDPEGEAGRAASYYLSKKFPCMEHLGSFNCGLFS